MISRKGGRRFGEDVTETEKLAYMNMIVEKRP